MADDKNARRWALAAAAAVLVAMGCSDDEQPTCEPDEIRSCACAGGGQGTQACAADGKSWSACDCPADGGADLSASDGAADGAADSAADGAADGAADAPAGDLQPDLGDGCAGSGLAVGVHTISITFAQKTRTFDLYVPSGFDNGAATPLVLDFHGFTSNRTQQRLISGMAAQADANGFLVAYADGWGPLKSWNAGDTCCGQALAQGLDDVGLVRAIVDRVAAAVCVDRKRVYAAGISNGGMLSYRLACEASDLIAAMAPVSGRLDFDPMSECNPPRKVPVIHFHGLNDALVPIQAARDSIDFWKGLAGCSGDPQQTYTKGESSCDSYTSCQNGVQVTLCEIRGGHVLYSNVDDVPLAQLAWPFLSQYALP